MSLAFLLTVLFFVADLALTGSAQFWLESPVPWVPAVTVTGSISRLLLGSEDQFLASLAPQSVSLVALLAWSVLPVIAAIARFRRIDIEESEVPRMAIVANALVVLVVVIHVYIVVLEMFLWRTERGMKAFGTDQAFADRSAPLAANQGLYNGFLVAGLVWGLLAVDPIGFQVKVFFLACVVIAGLYGAATVSRRILVVQALPAILALVAVVAAANIG